MKVRYKIEIRGNVQGVGFRPFVFRTASNLNLSGYVYNTPLGVFIEAEGEEISLQEFLFQIENNKPAISFISGIEYTVLDPIGYSEFIIKESKTDGELITIVPPDIAVCRDCINEMYDKINRRYLYPFINCTNCGPRYSIIEALPYDRKNTSMKIFNMCDDCKKEYENPADRRFHAQPIACPKCGPHVQLMNNNGLILVSGNNAIEFASELIKDGYIVALKGIGGYQLIVDASNKNAIKKLRIRKHRNEKPFALMFPNIEMIEEVCYVSPLEKRSLLSNEAPIVLLKNRTNKFNLISEECAPNNPYLGIMLPYSPLHYLLMDKLQIPIVATSGNISEEPICIDEEEAFTRLKNIADYFLVHNRPIVRHVDDSIVRIINNRQVVLRRARGFAPFPIFISQTQLTRQEGLINQNNDLELIAFGAHIKNSISLKKKNQIIISQHIGDLTTKESFKAFTRTINDLTNLHNISSPLILCDLHPEYISTKYAESLRKNLIHIQHHYAHISACKLENQIDEDALGVSWDGTGYGIDGTIWGGEFFITTKTKAYHIGQFINFPLPGGELSIKEPRRSLAGILWRTFQNKFNETSLKILNKLFNQNEIQVIKHTLSKNINSPLTSSVGRLFDAVSSLLNLCHYSSYEGQAAMMLEYIADEKINDYYTYTIIYNNKFIVDWKPIIIEIINDINLGIDNSIISGKFHNTLTHIILNISKITNSSKVLLSGGCFQNKLLTEKTITLLEENNIRTYIHQKIPPNDGGISVGQIAAYLFTKGEFSTDLNYLKRSFNNVSCNTR